MSELHIDLEGHCMGCRYRKYMTKKVLTEQGFPMKYKGAPYCDYLGDEGCYERNKFKLKDVVYDPILILKDEFDSKFLNKLSKSIEVKHDSIEIPYNVLSHVKEIIIKERKFY